MIFIIRIGTLFDMISAELAAIQQVSKVLSEFEIEPELAFDPTPSRLRNWSEPPRSDDPQEPEKEPSNGFRIEDTPIRGPPSKYKKKASTNRSI